MLPLKHSVDRRLGRYQCVDTDQTFRLVLDLPFISLRVGVGDQSFHVVKGECGEVFLPVKL